MSGSIKWVLRALEKTPELRFQQASEVKTCVETIAATPASGGSQREAAQTSEWSSHVSGTALLGAWLIVPFLFSIFFWDFGHKGGSAALVGVTLASLGFIAILATTVLGWIALGQIRRSQGRLRGLLLAMLEGLLLPVLLMDCHHYHTLAGREQAADVCLLSGWFPALNDSAFVNLPHYILWLLITAGGGDCSGLCEHQPRLAPGEPAIPRRTSQPTQARSFLAGLCHWDGGTGRHTYFPNDTGRVSGDVHPGRGCLSGKGAPDSCRAGFRPHLRIGERGHPHK